MTSGDPALPSGTARASGGIGRRAGFRFLCPKGREGSSPSSPTIRRTFVQAAAFQHADDDSVGSDLRFDVKSSLLPFDGDDAPAAHGHDRPADSDPVMVVDDEVAAIERWIRWNLDNYAEHGFGLWVIELIDGGTFLGDCGLTYQLVEGDRLLEVGYHLNQQNRGVGYATEAGRACIAFALVEIAAPLACSIVNPENTASIGVASRLHTSRRAFINESGQTRELFWSVRS